MSRDKSQHATHERTHESLAVIVPAYKGSHLAGTLAAFAAQTSRRFRVYVADDGSPEDLATIVAPFAGTLDLVYHRFPDNLGRVSLIRHWDRAIALSTELWIWLFSDDDLVSPDCVEAFWAQRAEMPATGGLHRFQCEFVDAAGRRRTDLPTFRYPPHQTWDEHVRSLARPGTIYVSIIQNVIFPRELYQRLGGFTEYHLGLWTDYITWARWAREEGLRTVAGGRVSYRIHDGSIGGALLHGGKDRTEFLRLGGTMFADLWDLYADAGKPAPDLELLGWFARLFRYSAFPLKAREREAAADALRRGWPRWPLVRETLFWWHASRPILKDLAWVRAVRSLRPFRASWAERTSPARAVSDEPIFCLYEDRPDCEVGVRLVLASLLRTHPQARVAFFTPVLSAGLQAWIAARPGIEWRPFNPEKAQGWNSKPDCLLELLRGGARNVVWLDSDLIVTGDLAGWLRRQPPDALVVAQDPVHFPQRGTRARALAWGFAAGPERGFTVNSCVVRATPSQLPLLQRWKELLCHPDYRRAQQSHILERPFHLAGDQDVLGALLGSAEFGGCELAVLRSGREVVHCGGIRMDPLGDRLRRFGGARPLCVHAMAVKPWHVLPGSAAEQNLNWRLLRLAQEMSSYLDEARSLRTEIGLPCPWLDHRTLAALFLRGLGLGSRAAGGVAFAAAVSVGSAAGFRRRPAIAAQSGARDATVTSP